MPVNTQEFLPNSTTRSPDTCRSRYSALDAPPGGRQPRVVVLANIREHDPDLAQKIQDQMFTFDNLLDLDDRSVQLLLREVQSESLIIALKGTSQELKDKIFKNMSTRAAEALKEDLEAKGAVRLSEVEGEQKEILKIIRENPRYGAKNIAAVFNEGKAESDHLTSAIVYDELRRIRLNTYEMRLEYLRRNRIISDEDFKTLVAAHGRPAAAAPEASPEAATFVRAR